MSWTDEEREYLVGADLLCIPDGKGCEGDSLGLSIHCTPMHLETIPEDDSKFACDVRQWPRAIHGQQLVEIFVLKDFSAPQLPRVLVDQPVTYRMMQYAPWQQAARAIWHKAFRAEVGQNPDFLRLMGALKRAHDQQHKLDETPVQHKQAAMFACLVETLRTSPNPLATNTAMGQVWARVDELMQEESFRENIRTFGLVDDPDIPAVEDLQACIDAVAGRSAVLRTSDVTAVADMLYNFYVIMAQRPDDEDDDELRTLDMVNPLDLAEQKLAAILAIPSFAHFLGCGLHVDISRQVLSRDIGPAGFVAVRFRPPGDNPPPAKVEDLVWTAYLLDEDGSEVVFQPRIRPSTTFSQPDYRGEYVNLGQELPKGGPRYVVSDLSPEGTLLHEFFARQHSMYTAKNPRPADSLKDETKRRGLAVMDKLAVVAVQEENNFLTKGNTAYFLNNLVAGVRPDIQRDGDEFYCATTRSIRCVDADFPAEWYRHPFVRDFLLYRDHAWTQKSTIERTIDSGLKRKELQDALFVFDGEPLGLTRSEEPQDDKGDTTVTPMRPGEGLALDFEVGPDFGERLPEGDRKMLCWPTLRERDRYRIGCRVAYVNGGGPGRDYGKVRADYTAGMPTIGDINGDSYMFKPMQPEPPRVLLHEFDDVIGADRQDEKGINATTVVLARARKQERIILPATYDGESAIKQGQFDGDTFSDNPVGQFGCRLQLAKDGVTFPEARYMGLYYVEGNKAKPVSGKGRTITIGEESNQLKPHRQSLGAVAKFTEVAPRRSSYFVDANWPGFAVQLGGALTKGAMFWTEKTPKDATPSVVRVERIGRNEQLTIETNKLIWIGNASDRKALRGVKLRVPRGRKFDLLLRPTDAQFQPYARPGTDHNRAAALTIVSPIVKPEAPSPNGNGSAVTGSYTAKETMAQLQNLLQRHVSTAPSEYGGSTAVFAGDLEIDARGSGHIWLTATWADWSVGGWYIGRDRRKREFLTANTLSMPVGNFDGKFADGKDQKKIINLADVENDSGSKGMTFPFEEGLSRYINLTVTAESHFAEHFSEKKPEDLRSSQTFDIALPCTKRGPPLKIATHTPYFNWEVIEFFKSRRAEERRKTKERLYLEGDLWATGEGEQVGVILGRADQAARYATTEGVDAYVSQSGVDPHLMHGDQPSRISLADFPDGTMAVEQVALVLTEDPDKAHEGLLQPVLVDIVPFDIQLENGRLFVELDLSKLAQRAHRPVAHLGLVRFQSNSINTKLTDENGNQRVLDLRASTPIRRDVKLLPQRHFRWERARSTCKVWLKGTMVSAANVSLTLYHWNTGGRGSRAGWWDAGQSIKADDAPGAEPDKVSFTVNRLDDETMLFLEEIETRKDYEDKENETLVFSASFFPLDRN